MNNMNIKRALEELNRCEFRDLHIKVALEIILKALAEPVVECKHGAMPYNCIACREIAIDQEKKKACEHEWEQTKQMFYGEECKICKLRRNKEYKFSRKGFHTFPCEKDPIREVYKKYKICELTINIGSDLEKDLWQAIKQVCESKE